MKNLTLALLFLLPGMIGYAQKLDTLAIDNIFASWNQPETPGCALGIVKDGALIYSKGFGLADLEHNLPIHSSSVFYIGSVSKQFVTFCILLLEEMGKLNLDAEIQTYLPDFPRYQAPLTIRHFIHHTSGVRDFITLMGLKGRNYLDKLNEKEVYALIKRQESLNFTPGERYLYSNSCYFMLAMIVQKVSGQSIRNFAQEHIFGPLGMESTLFYDDNRDLIKRKAFSYQPNGAGFDNLIMRFDLVGSGGIYSSVEDLLLWDENFYNNKLGRGGQAIVEKMHEEGLLNNGESSGYAYALINGNYKGLRTVSHGGALAGYRSQLMRFPDKRTSIIILANRADANPTNKAYQVADILFKGELQEKVESEDLPTEYLEELVDIYSVGVETFTGLYEIDPGFEMEVTYERDTLFAIQKWNSYRVSLFPADDTKFKTPVDPSLQFGFTQIKDEKSQVLYRIKNGYPTKAIRKDAIDPNEVDLEWYTGSYFSPELGTTYQITIQEEKLNVNIEHRDQFTLEISNTDQFTYNGALVDFHRSNGKITGFELDAGRVQNLKFEKVKD